MIEIYAAYQNADMTEGRGHMVLDRLFANKHDALEYVRNQKGVMGRSPRSSHERKVGETGWEGMGDWELRELTVLENYDEIREVDNNKLKARAIAKLTTEELRALGL